MAAVIKTGDRNSTPLSEAQAIKILEENGFDVYTKPVVRFFRSEGTVYFDVHEAIRLLGLHNVGGHDVNTHGTK